MNKQTFNLRADISSDQYEKLLRFVSEFCDSFILVVRNTIELSPTGHAVLERLQPFLISKANTSEWPGTKLLSDSAEVYRYRLSAETTVILKESASGLFSWIQPKLPEDLCFMRNEMEPFLVTIAHEKDAYLILSLAEKFRLEAAIPNL